MRGPDLALRVDAIAVVAEGVRVFDVVDPAGGALPPWAPGAHLEVCLPSGLVRHYSLCGDPADATRYRFAVLLDPGGSGGSVELHAQVGVGDALVVRGPRNHFALDDAPAYTFVAGGIGITPILAMVRDAAARGVPWTLLYGGRSRTSMAFLDELAGVGGGQVLLVPQDEAGVPDIATYLGTRPPGGLVYCCGPRPMLAAVVDEMARRGDDAALRLERFESAGEGPVTGEGDVPVEVELRATGVVLTVPPDRSILDVVADVVPDVMSSCGEGYCGTCETPVLDGIPDHRDTLLSEEDQASNETMLICVSRSRTPRLVLDL